MLDCNPHLNDIKELVNELNRTNGLFKFVRSMRQKFQETAAQGIDIILESTKILHASKVHPLESSHRILFRALLVTCSNYSYK